MLGFYRIAAAQHEINVGHVLINQKNIQTRYEQAVELQVQLLAFPELSLTGATCGDLFFSSQLIAQCEKSLFELIALTANKETLLILGLPFKIEDQLFNCAAIIGNGQLLGLVPKTHLTKHEQRYFTSAFELKNGQITFNGQIVNISNTLIFSNEKEFTFGIEIGEDAFAPIPQSALLASAGAKVIINLAAHAELVEKTAQRNAQMIALSERLHVGYLYATSQSNESISTALFSGRALIAEDGDILAERQPFDTQNQLLIADVDCQKLSYIRQKNNFSDTVKAHIEKIRLPPIGELTNLQRYYTPTPFLSDDPVFADEMCSHIFEILVHALRQKLKSSHCKSVVLGVSGGLDSTLALLVACAATETVYPISMPGLGTSSRTKNNTITLCEAFNLKLKTIDITPAIHQHFKDIEHDIKIKNATYENSQARERTQILMDIANQEHSLVLGTGDLSEIALGWATYNGDHMSMFNLNSALPKTVIQKMIDFYIRNMTSIETLKTCLIDILQTPISPELLPHKNNEISQQTEELIGPYLLHDFFIYHMLKNGASHEKLRMLASHVFSEQFDSTLRDRTLEIFIRRFYTQQFKRACSPDGVKVWSISLDRNDFILPCDLATFELTTI